MRIKNIEPGMHIHCANDKEKRILLEEAERLGYVWYSSRAKPTSIMPSGSIITFNEPCEILNVPHLTWSAKASAIETNQMFVEMCDMIIPDMDGRELMKWFKDNYNRGTINHIFGEEYTFTSLLSKFSPDEIVKKIEEYEQQQNVSINKSIKHLSDFTDSFCLDQAKTYASNKLVFKCNNCTFRNDSGKCLIKMFAKEQLGYVPETLRIGGSW